VSFPARETAAILLIGIVGVLIPGLQPQLLGALAAEGRVSLAALGPLATVELLAMGVAAGLAGAVLPTAGLRAMAVVALLVTAAFDLATPHATGPTIFAARVGAGLGEGVLVWVAIGFIVRTAAPERWSGVYLALQTLAQFAVASGLGAVAAGSGAGFATLAAITAAGLLAVPLLPRGYAPLAPVGTPGDAASPAARGALALLGVLLYLACVVAVWVYVEPLGLARGVPAAWVRVIAPLSLAMQVLGAGAATLLADRLPARATLVAVAAGNVALIAVMASAPSTLAFVAASAVFGFLWLFAMPFQIPLVIAADPTRRAAQLIGGAQLAGSGAGPFAAGMIAGEQVTVVPWIGAAALVVGVALLLAASTRRA
jgi:DHA1 family inner membrane transport protein